MDLYLCMYLFEDPEHKNLIKRIQPLINCAEKLNGTCEKWVCVNDKLINFRTKLSYITVYFSVNQQYN